MQNKIKPLFLIHTLYFFCFCASGLDTNTLYPGQALSENKTLTSKNGLFTLGFICGDIYGCPGFGIRYSKLPANNVVWTANDALPEIECGYTQNPMSLTVSKHGDFLINCGGYSTKIWSSSLSSEFNSTSNKLVLEDNGNLVFTRILNPNTVLWQSFDYPTDTWLPGAKIKIKEITQTKQIFGAYSLELDPKKMKTIIFKQDGKRYGSCRVLEFTLSCLLDLGWYKGEADFLMSKDFIFSYVSNENETYLTYNLSNPTILGQIMINPDNGLFVQLVWSKKAQAWEVSNKLRLSDTYCDQFVTFSHKREYDSNECPTTATVDYPKAEISTKSFFQCHEGTNEGFLLIYNASLSSSYGTIQQHSPKGCEKTCLHDYCCTAYTEKFECLLWQEGSQNVIYDGGLTMHIKIATGKLKSRTNAKTLGATLGGIILSIITLVFLILKCRNMKIICHESSKVMEGSLMFFKYSELRRATNNFTNKIGEGGFGYIFIGNLSSSSERIAVKKLKHICQGEKQFRAEVSTLGTINHVNLVRLKGFCIQRTQRILVYDYITHGSLDKHLFGGSNLILDWETRYKIAFGIAKGLAYLHGECKYCIIHCDIKPENILLDETFNPKLSDFGLAKIMGRDFSRVLTTMRGTRGYLAPEWISGVAITPKADVYSYGMMLFEIISGKRNWYIRINGEDDYTPLQAMQKLIYDGEVMSLLDDKLDGSANAEELIKMCRIAGWCIQDDENSRPLMTQIVQVFEGVIEVNTPPMPRFLQSIADMTNDSQTLASSTQPYLSTDA